MTEEIEKIIATDEELKMLFPNQIQREIFANILLRIIESIVNRTTLGGAVRVHF